MTAWQEMEKNLNQLLKLQTLPLGARIIESEKECPKNAKRPRDFDLKMTLCQLINMALEIPP